ncbi:curli production assembly/transport protein CsgE [Aliivibrio fischeri]|uniref:curli production assembly/transport protein CsgE n=1 Tax=Aliivibrio fischeri TaxID=668 RepID=UPI0007C59248|nr:curli production assembly/transport protein CsgE [Aliivibrio fischeri]MBP3143018.1 curli production assembly/transport protein CsgE [Aliivibrio fischeri]MBP3156361.1 curli production assembly/transport protein CsgE [Aliivibrio fischeri]MCE7567995.1 curli production assembly/transport protein CsgE [Aliivibrio fischeri]MCE7575020.1 curli production assembly/transport protein CsgE [Aliivibrio fischeri]MUK41960.1 curli production assembly protein CsgE [Aliivibrio fischeri]
MNIKYISIVFFTSFISFASDNKASLESKAPLENNSINEVDDLIEIDGLIIDRTLTRLGRDFYFSFSMKMNARYEDIDVNLTIKERPTALSGSIIGVYHFDKVIYRSALSPGQRQADEKAEQALEAVNKYIVKWQTEKLFKDTFDLDYSEI